MNSLVMIALGSYRFGLTTAAHQRLQRRSTYPWVAQERLGRLPARQKTREAERDEPLLMVDGKGIVYGLKVILSIHDGQSEFFADNAPRAQRFRMELGLYGEDGA